MDKCQPRPSPALPVALPVAWPAALPMALPAAREPMLLLAITEFVANSAAFTYFTAGALRRNVSSNMVGTAPAAAAGQSCPRRGPAGVSLRPPMPCGPSTLTPLLAFQLPQRFPLQLRTKSMGHFAPQVGEGGTGHGEKGTQMGHGVGQDAGGVGQGMGCRRDRTWDGMQERWDTGWHAGRMGHGRDGMQGRWDTGLDAGRMGRMRCRMGCSWDGTQAGQDVGR